MIEDGPERMRKDPGALPGYRTVLALEHGGSLDGLMLTGEMLRITGLEYHGDPELVDEEGGFYDFP